MTRCSESHVLDFDSVDCALDVGHAGMHVADAEDGPIVWERRDVVLEDEVTKAVQANEIAEVAMAATDEGWLPLDVRYGVADRLWDLGYRKVVPPEEEANENG